MRKPNSKAQKRHITAADVGRYVKHLAALHRDPLTGNAAMSSALNEIAAVLISARAAPATKALEKYTSQNEFNFEDEIDFETISLDKVREMLNRPELTKADLAIIGGERFGIARSRMERSNRDEIVQMINSALQHEESLNIISEEAQRQSRTS